MVSNPLPSATLVIPTYDRPQALAACLDAVAAVDYPHDRLEIIVVDDGSPSDLQTVVEPRQRTMPLRLLRQTNRGPASARNHGTNHAQGQLVAFLDDDCRPEPAWLSQLAQASAQNPQALIGGQTINELTDNLCSTASQLLIDYLYEYFRDRSGQFFASNNFALPVGQFHELGGFDTDFPLAAGEDREFCRRWAQRGWPLMYEPSARIGHFHHLSPRKYLKQHFNYGRGAYNYHRLNADPTQSKIRPEPLTFYANLIAMPYKRTSPVRATALAGLMGLSQLANTSGFFYERFHRPAAED